MKLVYTPEGDPLQEWPIRLQRMMSVEAEAIEDVGGNTWGSFDEFMDKLARGNFRAKRALLWMMLRRQNPRLRFSDLVVRYDELAFAAEDKDREEAREMLQRDDLSPEDRAELEELLGEPESVIEELEPLGKEGGDDTTTDSPLPEPVSEPSLSN